jgi:hypothetical protein
MELTTRAEGTYFTLNPLDPSLLGRRYNRAEIAMKDLATDKDVLIRRWLLIDTDPVRPSGVSATSEEKLQAWQSIRNVHQWLQEQGWPEPILCDSGNGYHLLYRIDLPSDDGGLVKDVLKSIASRFDNARVKIDTSVFNPGRIVKLYGSTASKGDSLRARPHRRTGVLNVPVEMVVVTSEQLLQVRGDVPAAQPGAVQQPNITSLSNSLAAGVRAGLVQRARSYLSKVPGAIAGQGGSNQTFKAACILARFGLSDDDSMLLFREWNEKCVPPWDEKDLQKKLRDARVKVGSARMTRQRVTENEDNATNVQGNAGPRYVAIRGGDGDAADDPTPSGIFDREQNDGSFISNFVLELDEDIAVLDDIENQRAFKGRLTIMGRSVPFRINAEDYADNNKLKAAIFQAGGPEVQIFGRMDQLRTAISAISVQDRTIRRREITTNFGWKESAYLVPSGRITGTGFEVNDDLSLRVDLGDEEQAGISICRLSTRMTCCGSRSTSSTICCR